MKTLLIVSSLLLVRLASAQDDPAKTLFTKGYELIGRQAYPEAVDYLLGAIVVDSTGDCGTGKKGTAQSETGYAYLKIGDFTRAEEYFNRAIKLDSLNPSPRLNKVAMYNMQFKQDEAIRELSDLIRVRPDYVDGYLQRGMQYYTNNLMQNAADDFEAALKLNEKANALRPEEVTELKNRVREIRKSK